MQLKAGNAGGDGVLIEVKQVVDKRQQSADFCLLSTAEKVATLI